MKQFEKENWFLFLPAARFRLAVISANIERRKWRKNNKRRYILNNDRHIVHKTHTHTHTLLYERDDDEPLHTAHERVIISQTTAEAPAWNKNRVFF